MTGRARGQEGRDSTQRPGGGLRDERRQLHDEVARRHILEAAERVFGRRGFDQATIREIAKEAEFSTAALYNFFEGKDDLFATVMDVKGQGVLDALEQATADGLSARAKLHALADAQLAYYSAHRNFFRIIIRTTGPSWWTMKADLDDTSDNRFRLALDLETAVFREGLSNGEFRAGDPETMAVLFLGIMQAYLARWLLSDAADADIEGYPVDELHNLLDRAFVASS